MIDDPALLVLVIAAIGELLLLRASRRCSGAMYRGSPPVVVSALPRATARRRG